RHRAARLPGDPGHRADVLVRLCDRQPVRRSHLRRARPEDPVLMQDGAHTATIPGAAAPLPDILPPVRKRVGISGFIYRHPTMAIGGIMLLILLFIAVFAPLLGAGDPNAIAPAKRNREPSAEYWFGTDAFGKDIYARVLYGARISLIVGFSVALLASISGLAIGLVSGF